MRLAVSLLLLVASGFAQDAKQEGRERDVIYGRKHGLSLTMDVFTPQAPKNTNGGAVLYVVSSGWFSAPRAMRVRRYAPLLERGYTVFSVVHGSTPKYTIAEIAPDIHRAVRFVRFHHKRFAIDPQRIAIMGTSAGGHLALLIATAGDTGNPEARDAIQRVSSRVQAVAAFFPPTDFLNWGKPGVKITETVLKDRFKGPFDFHVLDRKSNSFQPVEDPTPLLKSLSPITHASKDDPPAILFHGTRDPVVPRQQSDSMAKKLKAAGATAQVVIKEGKSHGWRGMAEDVKTVADWFDKHMPTKGKQD